MAVDSKRFGKLILCTLSTCPEGQFYFYENTQTPFSRHETDVIKLIGYNIVFSIMINLPTNE